MNRRSFLKTLAALPAIELLRPARAAADLPKAKITRVRIYRPPPSLTRLRRMNPSSILKS